MVLIIGRPMTYAQIVSIISKWQTRFNEPLLIAPVKNIRWLAKFGGGRDSSCSNGGLNVSVRGGGQASPVRLSATTA